jgi:hypothetical protein
LAGYFETVANCLRHDVEQRRNNVEGPNVTTDHFPHEIKVTLRWAPSVARLLWEVVSDVGARNRAEAANLGCLLEHRIRAQLAYELDDDDLEFYKGVIASLDSYVESMRQVAVAQRMKPSH